MFCLRQTQRNGENVAELNELDPDEDRGVNCQCVLILMVFRHDTEDVSQRNTLVQTRISQQQLRDGLALNLVQTFMVSGG